MILKQKKKIFINYIKQQAYKKIIPFQAQAFIGQRFFILK